MRISVSIFTPKGFSMRRAMSPERSDLPLSKLESAGRETRSAAVLSLSKLVDSHISSYIS
jgi:hypothetical protein